LFTTLILPQPCSLYHI